MYARSRFVTFTMAVAVVSLAGLFSGVSAQAPMHEVQLVAGDCEASDGPVNVLGELSSGADLAGARVEMGEIVKALGSTVSSGQIALPGSLEEISARAHAIRIVERGQPPGRLVACGEFGGGAGSVSDLQVGLAGIEASDPDGVVWLHDNGDGTTGATIAVATIAVAIDGPAADAAVDSGEVEVVIRKSLYLPTPLEVEAGTTVTWINEDALPHTTTASGGLFDSGYMPLDARFSHTFDEPGEYPIYCVYHPRMRAVVIVS